MYRWCEGFCPFDSNAFEQLMLQYVRDCDCGYFCIKSQVRQLFLKLYWQTKKQDPDEIRGPAFALGEIVNGSG